MHEQMLKVIKSLKLSVPECVLKDFNQDVENSHWEVLVNVIISHLYLINKLFNSILFLEKLLPHCIKFSIQLLLGQSVS